LALIAIAAALALGLWSATRPTPGARIARLSIHLPAGETLAASWWWSPSLALSPDGTSVVWVASRAGASRLYVRALDQYEARALPGTEGVESVFFSPDGQWVGFITEDQLLKKVSLSGGAPQTLGNAQSAKGACWGGGDTIYFAPGAPLGIHRISTSGGRAEPVTALDPKREEIAHAWPELLPGGKALLFTVRTAKQPSFDEAEIAALSLGTGQRKTLVQGGTSPHYLPTGHLLFVRAGTLMAAPFDPARLELTGPAVPALENVRENPRVGAAQLAVARDGTLAYIPGGISFGNQTLVRVDRKGAGEPLSALKRPFEDFTLSPDGRFIATTVEGGVTDVWLLDIARDSLARFTFGVENRDPVWTPDGKRLVFAAYRDGKWGLFAKPVEGSGLEERLTSSDYPGSPLCYTPDGKVLIYGQTDPQTRDDIWILPLAEGKPRPLIKTPFAEEWAMISPDGRWLAYTSDESGRPEVYAQPFPGPGGKWKISSEGGIRPAWRHDGRELYYRNGGALLAVPVDTRAGFAAGKPEKLFEGHYLSSFHDYAPTRDGRFILMREAEQDATELRVVLGWRDELQARIPGAKR
jgi:Tol biopolymer transport system component